MPGAFFTTATGRSARTGPEGPRHETARSFSASFCGNLGQEKRSAWDAEAGVGGGPGSNDVSLQACVSWQTSAVKKKKSPGQSVHQPVDRRLRTTAQLPLVLLRCACACGGLGGAISEAETCLKRTNCRLWAGQGAGTADTLKIAHARGKFRGGAQVTGVFRLQHICLV